MLIELWRKVLATDYSRTCCGICGNDFERGTVFPMAFTDHRESIGEMCPPCLDYVNRRKRDGGDPTGRPRPVGELARPRVADARGPRGGAPTLPGGHVPRRRRLRCGRARSGRGASDAPVELDLDHGARGERVADDQERFLIYGSGSFGAPTFWRKVIRWGVCYVYTTGVWSPWLTSPGGRG